jgi:hypothetical protein
LALVAAVAELHGIELVADDNRPGLRMTMAFVARRPQPAEEQIPSHKMRLKSKIRSPSTTTVRTDFSG